MSRHSRHRQADQRRPGPAGRTEIALPPRPAPSEGPEPGRSFTAQVEDQPTPESAVDDAPAIALAALHLPTAANGVVDETGIPGGTGCTPAQLRRFIKSRAYLPVHEIRRRFGMETADDDVTGFEVESGRVFVGLPQREGRILGDLVRAGEVGYELQLDPEAPIIIGVYPMRPVTRQ
jgi:hypothetical protein